MAENFLGRLFEHNNWANMAILRACEVLSDEQLDAEPQTATAGSIRSTLIHLAAAQQGYLRLLTLPVEERMYPLVLEYDEVEGSLKRCGDALLDFARDEASIPMK